jgi:hypothetical protein
MTIDDIDIYEDYYDFQPDKKEIEAHTTFLEFFKTNNRNVFYSKQLEVTYEKHYYHWVTNRALHRLHEEGEILMEEQMLNHGIPIKLLWHKSLRYPKRAGKEIVALVNKYSSPDITASVGQQGEFLVLEAFTRFGFKVIGRNTNELDGNQWVETNHDIDFIFERDSVRYGFEVKNTLSYMNSKELEIKIRLCKSLGILPVFAVRMMPSNWIEQLRVDGGFALILKYQMYPLNCRSLVEEIKGKLNLPVDTPSALFDGTVSRFINHYHTKNM